MRAAMTRGLGIFWVLTAVFGAEAQAQTQLQSQPIAGCCENARPSPQAAELGGAGGDVIARLKRMSREELLSCYRAAAGNAIELPQGRVRGVDLPSPGSPFNPILSKGAEWVWQGKTFGPQPERVKNRFFGIPSVPGHVFAGQSWYDGAPALIIDYSQTSRIYRPMRDEFRVVAPGVQLGLMYKRNDRDGSARLVRFFLIRRDAGNVTLTPLQSCGVGVPAPFGN